MHKCKMSNNEMAVPGKSWKSTCLCIRPQKLDVLALEMMFEVSLPYISKVFEGAHHSPPKVYIIGCLEYYHYHISGLELQRCSMEDASKA